LDQEQESEDGHQGCAKHAEAKSQAGQRHKAEQGDKEGKSKAGQGQQEGKETQAIEEAGGAHGQHPNSRTGVSEQIQG